MNRAAEKFDARREKCTAVIQSVLDFVMAAAEHAGPRVDPPGCEAKGEGIITYCTDGRPSCRFDPEHRVHHGNALVRIETAAGRRRDTALAALLAANIKRRLLNPGEVAAYPEGCARPSTIWRRHMGKPHLATARAELGALVDGGRSVEIEATAALPPVKGALP